MTEISFCEDDERLEGRTVTMLSEQLQFSQWAAGAMSVAGVVVNFVGLFLPLPTWMILCGSRCHPEVLLVESVMQWILLAIFVYYHYCMLLGNRFEGREGDTG